MSARLVVAALEIRRGNEPDWDAAQAELGKLSRDKASVIVRDFGDMSFKGNPFVRLEKAFERIKSAWSGEHNGSFAKLNLSNTDLLIGGDHSDARIESVDDVSLFIESGLAEAAGFIVD